MIKRIELVIGVLFVIIAAVAGYRLAVSKVKLDIYRDRLAGLTSDYESLRTKYNEAVARTAITELVVADGGLSVAIRTVRGVERVIETPFDPTREIYCDYVLVDGRLWIRRVYDALTPPGQALVIDDDLADVDWNDPAALYGKAVYRPLGEGRWIVTVTGDGSLGLAKAERDATVTLSGPPPVRDYAQMEKQIDEEVSEVSATEVITRAVGLSK